MKVEQHLYAIGVLGSGPNHRKAGTSLLAYLLLFQTYPVMTLLKIDLQWVGLLEYVNSDEKTNADCMEMYFLTAELKSCLHNVKVVSKFRVMEVEPNSSSR